MQQVQHLHGYSEERALAETAAAIDDASGCMLFSLTFTATPAFPATPA